MTTAEEKIARDSSNVSSTIMYKIPTNSLGALRSLFEKSLIGLNLVGFLAVMVKTMDLGTEKELLQIIPDLVDFFKSVDINGDGKMEWSEFVMFVIESVVVTDQVILEKVQNVEHSLLQSASSRHGVKCSKIIPEFNRLFIGIGPSVLIFETDDKSPTWLGSPVQLRLTHRVLEEDVTREKPLIRQPKDDKVEKSLQCLDFVYLGAREMLVVLRSDMSLEFHRFMARNKVSADLIQQNGFWVFEQPYNKIVLREIPRDRGAIKVPWKVFLIGESRSIVDSWTITVGVTGIVSLEDHFQFDKHTDYVTDILVINNMLLHYNYFVTCGLDKKVHIYDLITLKHKATRTGHTAGVQCLAYDNRSLLFAGGFDYNIIVWDLDAEIDRPIFQLWGHQSPITKIVAMGNIERSYSLDSSGQIRFWDTSKSNPNDKEARQIDDFNYVDDTLRSFDVFQKVSSNFETAHSVILAAQGRRQHTYKIIDMTPKESPPIARGILFTYNLLTMITVHSHDAIFFSAISGDEQKKMNRTMLNLDGIGNEVMSCCLDDRQRKLIIGEASGKISVYNILSGVRLKTTAKNIPFGIRDMIYTPDKIIIALAGPGELYIFDELPNDDNVDAKLRYVQAHDVDIVSMDYSYEMGLIATADCTGTVKIWDFEYLQIQTIINDINKGSEIGQVKFIDKYPLLLVSDPNSNFTIIPVGPAFEALGKKMWRVESVICTDKESKLHDTSVLTPPPPPTPIVGVLDDAVKDPDADITEEGVNLDKIQKDGKDDEGSSEQKKNEDGSLEDDDEEDDEDEEQGSKPLKKKLMKEFIRKRHEVKSMHIYVQKSESMLEEEAFENNEPEETSESRLLELLGSRIDEEEEDDISKHSSDSEEEEEIDPRREELLKKSCTTAGFPEHGVRVFAFCGTDDGHVSIVDLTPTLREIDMGHLMNHEWIPNRKLYDPRRAFSVKVRDNEIETFTWKPNQLTLGTEISTCNVSLIWRAHAAAITTLYTIKENDTCDILTGSQDCAVYTWTFMGTSKGTLTRGRDWDKLFRPRWRTPVDITYRESRRIKDANILCDALGLTKFMHGGAGAGSKRDKSDNPPGSAEIKNDKNDDRGAISAIKSAYGGKGHGQGQAGEEKQHSNSSSSNNLSSSSHNNHEDTHNSLTRESSFGSMEDDPERTRVIGQLAGRITYKMSNKDQAAGMLGNKHSKSMELIANIGKGDKKKKKKNKSQFDIDAEEIVERSSEGIWLDSLMGGSSGIGVETERGRKISRSNSNSIATKGGKPRKIKTKYDIELQAIEERDPNNWEISSTNRQRALYNKLFSEMDKAGLTKNPLAIFEHKLNNLSPNGDFRSYVARLWVERRNANNRKTDGSTSQVMDNNNSEAAEFGSQKSNQEDEELIEKMSYNVRVGVTFLDEESDMAIVKEESGIFKSPKQSSSGLTRVRVNNEEKVESYKDYSWETSLRLPLYPSPLTPPKKELKSPIPESKVFTPPPISPVRLTPAQLIAIEERQAVIDLKESFEQKMSLTDTMGKSAKRIIRNKKKEHRKLTKSHSAISMLSPVEKIKLSMRGALPDSQAPDPIDTRNTLASLVHSKALTIDDVMEVDRKQKQTEASLARKMKFALSEDDDKSSRSSIRKTPRNDEQLQTSKDVNAQRSEKLSGSRDARILSKKEFGPYKTKLLFQFLRIFQSFPPEIIEVEEDLMSSSIMSMSTAKSGDVFKKAQEDSDDDSWPSDNESLDGSSIMVDPEIETEEMIRLREVQEAAEEEIKAAQYHKEVEAKHANDVVMMNIRLLHLINSKFMQLNPNFKNELQKVLLKRTEDGTLPRNVLISLTDALTFACNYMNTQERTLTLRYFVLKTPRTTAHVEAIEKGLTREQLKKLKAMFEFFDKDGSGGIDKFEITEVLEKLASNKKKEVTSDKLNEDEDKGVDLSDAEALISSVQGHEAEELDFEAFCRMFKSLVE